MKYGDVYYRGDHRASSCMQEPRRDTTVIRRAIRRQIDRVAACFHSVLFHSECIAGCCDGRYVIEDTVLKDVKYCLANV